VQTIIDDIIAAERLPTSYREIVDQWWRPLARQIGDWRNSAVRPVVVGVNGAQGSGKSTLCRFLEAALLPELGLSAVVVGLDDLYLPLKVRAQLARDVHPLFQTRGVPATHDVDIGLSIFKQLVAGREAVIPRFSKALDDRLPESDWVRHHGKVDIILLEGWCVGARPQDEASLLEPINALEAVEDKDRIWRNHVNAALKTSYARFFSAIDHMVMLKPPSFEHVLKNRLLQEHKLRTRTPDAPGIMDDDGVRRFVNHYERLTRHMFADLPDRVDLLLQLGVGQDILSCRTLRSCDREGKDVHVG
jgi:D-glycerate 3-kinase